MDTFLFAQFFYDLSKLTHEKLSLPIVWTPIQRYLKVNPPLSFCPWHDAGCPVLVKDRSFAGLSVEPTSDSGCRFEARPSDVHHRSTQHVAVLRGKSQGQICSSCKGIVLLAMVQFAFGRLETTASHGLRPDEKSTKLEKCV